MMTEMIDGLKQTVPAFAADTRLNIQNVLTPEGSPGLTSGQIAGAALAAAYALKSEAIVRSVGSFAAEALSAAEVQAVKTAVSLMAMNNVYYRFLHLSEDPEYRQMPARLRMTAMANPGVPKLDFEIYSLSVSAVNGCGMCVQSHAAALVRAGLTKEGVQSVARIAAVVASAAQAVFIG